MSDSKRNRLLGLNRALLLLCLAIYIFLGVFRALPYNVISRDNIAQSRGAALSSVYVNFKYAKKVYARGDAPSGDTGSFGLSDHLIHRGHNPGFFRFVTVVSYGAGIRELFGLQMIPLALSTATLAALYFLVLGVFGDRWLALFAAAFAAFSPTFLTQATSLGASPYGKVGQLAAVLFFLRFLRSGRRAEFAAAYAFYFLACWNYWQWYVGTGMLLAGVHFLERRRWFSRDLGVVLTAPIAAFTSFLLLMTLNRGGFAKAIKWMYSVVAFRVADKTEPGGYFAERYESGNFLGDVSFGSYLSLVAGRIPEWYYLAPLVLVAMLVLAILASPPERRGAYRFFWFAIPASVYWQMVMVQHTVIHDYTASYHYFAITLIFACFCREIPGWVARRFAGRRWRWAVGVLAVLPIALPVAGSMGIDIVPRQISYMKAWAKRQAEPKQAPIPPAALRNPAAEEGTR